MKPLLWRTFWLFGAIGAVLALGYLLDKKVSETSYYSDKSLCFIEGNSLLPISPLYYPHTLVYGSIIGCLEWEESRGNANAINPCDTDGYPKYGLLQYHIPTFEWFCVEQYGFRNEIMNPEIQKLCADRMIKNGYGYLWGTWDECVHN